MKTAALCSATATEGGLSTVGSGGGGAAQATDLASAQAISMAAVAPVSALLNGLPDSVNWLLMMTISWFRVIVAA